MIDYDIRDYAGNQDLSKIRQYIDNFETQFYSVNLYFWSRMNSTQKTTVASYIGNMIDKKEHIKKDNFGCTKKSSYDVRFVSMYELITDLTNEQFQEECRQKIKEYQTCDFLIIDDSFAKDKITIYKSGYQIPALHNFLKKRMEQLEKATCFTANVPIKEIGNLTSVSIQSLINRRVYELEFTDEIPGQNIDKIFDI